MGRCLRKERRKGRTRERTEESGRNGRELGAEPRGVETRNVDTARCGVAHTGTGRWMAGLGELGLRARLLSAVRSAALRRCLNIH